MPLPDFPTKRLAQIYTEAAKAALPRLTKTFARMIAQVFEGKTRHVIDFERGDPWDDSGELIDTEMPFVLENYVTVEDFWKEYEGGREPSYESGRGWNYPTFGDIHQREIPELLTPYFTQALERLAQDEPSYYAELVAYIHREWNDAAETPDELLSEMRFNDLMGDTEIACEILVAEHLQALLLASLLQRQQIPRCCQRSLLEAIPNLVPFIAELAGYCETVAHVTSLNEDGPLQLHVERTDDGIIFGHEGARELLMDHIAQQGSLILRANLTGTDAVGQSLEGLQGVRGWFITFEDGAVMPHRILPDDLYEAMNTDAETGAKLPPEPQVRYL